MRRQTSLSWVSILLLASFLSQDLMAQKYRTDSGPFLGSAGTLSRSAVFAPFLSTIDGGGAGDAAISVSNAMPPDMAGGISHDEKGRTGPFRLFLVDSNGDTYVFDSTDHPTVGIGLDENGNLKEGRTWQVLLSEVIRATVGEDRDFNGYAWIVADFDWVAGTSTNFFRGLGISQSVTFQAPTPELRSTQEVLHDFQGPLAIGQGLTLRNFRILGPLDPAVGDKLETRFSLVWNEARTETTAFTFGKYGVFAATIDPWRKNRDFGHRFQNAQTDPAKGLHNFSFVAEIVLDLPGDWAFWPAYSYFDKSSREKWGGGPVATVRVDPLESELLGISELDLQKPSCMVDRSMNRLTCSALGSDRKIYWKTWDTNRWDAWQSLGGVGTSRPETIEWELGAEVVGVGFDLRDLSGGGPFFVVRGTDNALYWRPPGTEWESLNGDLASAPGCLPWEWSGNGWTPQNRLACFSLKSDKTVWWRRNDGTHWTVWEEIGGKLTSAPECLYWKTGMLYCFGRGGSKELLWSRWWEGQQWRQWESLGGVLTSAPSCVASGGLLHCFVRGTDSALWWTNNTTGSGWSKWLSLGGVLASAPQCLSFLNGTGLACFVRGTDNALYWRYNDGHGWKRWERLGGLFMSSPPECVGWGGIHCFARSTDGAIYWNRLEESTWNEWQDLGEPNDPLDSVISNLKVEIQTRGRKGDGTDAGVYLKFGTTEYHLDTPDNDFEPGSNFSQILDLELSIDHLPNTQICLRQDGLRSDPSWYVQQLKLLFARKRSPGDFEHYMTWDNIGWLALDKPPRNSRFVCLQP